MGDSIALWIGEKEKNKNKNNLNASIPHTKQ